MVGNRKGLEKFTRSKERDTRRGVPFFGMRSIRYLSVDDFNLVSIILKYVIFVGHFLGESLIECSHILMLCLASLSQRVL